MTPVRLEPGDHFQELIAWKELKCQSQLQQTTFYGLTIHLNCLQAEFEDVICCKNFLGCLNVKRIYDKRCLFFIYNFY